MRPIVLLALLVTAAHAQGPRAAYPSVKTKKTLYAKTDLRGKAAPKLFTEQWLTGKAPDTKGKVLVLDFWATWCGPCRATIPELNGIAKKFAKDIVVVGLSKEKPEVVREFMKTTKMEYNVAIDTQGRTDKVVGVQGIPHVLVVTPDGIVRWQGFPLDDAEPLTEATLAKIVAVYKQGPKSLAPKPVRAP